MEYTIVAKTDIGIHRDSNQDSLFARTAAWGEREYAFAIICDGMGGLTDGEYASKLTVQTFGDWFFRGFGTWLQNGEREDELFRTWQALLQDSNNKLLRYGQENGIKVGTTATMLLLGPYRYAVMHIGDTRVYEISDTVRQLTKDHTLAQKKVDEGSMKPDAVSSAPENHVLTRCVGTQNDIDPDFLTGNTLENTVYMLCTDGFRNKLQDREIYEAFSRTKHISDSTLLSACTDLLTLGKQRCETDNLSVIAISTTVQNKSNALTVDTIQF